MCVCLSLISLRASRACTRCRGVTTQPLTPSLMICKSNVDAELSCWKAAGRSLRRGNRYEAGAAELTWHRCLRILAYAQRPHEAPFL